MHWFVRDLRYAVRRLVREPRFTAAVLATLALCLGANLTIFAIVDAVLLRPLPFPGADRLVTIYNTYPNAGVLRDGASVTNYYERRGRLPAFTSLAILSSRHRCRRRGPSDRVRAGDARVVGLFLDTRRGAGQGAHVHGR